MSPPVSFGGSPAAVGSVPVLCCAESGGVSPPVSFPASVSPSVPSSVPPVCGVGDVEGGVWSTESGLPADSFVAADEESSLVVGPAVAVDGGLVAAAAESSVPVEATPGNGGAPVVVLVIALPVGDPPAIDVEPVVGVSVIALPVGDPPVRDVEPVVGVPATPLPVDGPVTVGAGVAESPLGGDGTGPPIPGDSGEMPRPAIEDTEPALPITPLQPAVAGTSEDAGVTKRFPAAAVDVNGNASCTGGRALPGGVEAVAPAEPPPVARGGACPGSMARRSGVASPSRPVPDASTSVAPATQMIENPAATRKPASRNARGRA